MGKLPILVAYALPEKQIVLAVEVQDGATIEQAIQASSILEQCPEIDLSVNKTGIYGHVEPLDKVVRADDRVEIYRAITCDPKEVRRQRAKQAKEKKKV